MPPPEARSGPRSVGRVLSILDTLASARSGLTLTELAQRTASPKTSLLGLLAVLVAEAWLSRDDAGRYRLASRFIELAGRVASGPRLVAVARPVMADLAAATGETAVLGVLAPDADVALYLERVESENPVRYTVAAGTRRELYCTAIGKVLLAHFDRPRQEAYLQAVPRPQFTPNTRADRDALISDLVEIREVGIAHTRDERVMGASGIAAPIFGTDRNVVAALLIAGPSERIQRNAGQIERRVRAAADACSRQLRDEPGVEQDHAVA